MSRMLDLVRASALPWQQMMTASKGALHLPAEEMVEILVYLAEHNKIMGEQARLTLAGWDEASAKTIAANPNAPKEILNYWVSPKNLRAALFPLLLENSSVSIGRLSDLATHLKGEWADAMIASPRMRGSWQLLADLRSNTQLTGVQTARVQELITGKPATAASEPIPAAQEAAEVPADAAPSDSNPQIHAPAAESTTQANVEMDPHAISPESDPETEDAL